VLIAEACDWNFGLGLHAGGGHAAQSWEQSIDQAVADAPVRRDVRGDRLGRPADVAQLATVRSGR
jgi:hypothetical protein